MQAVIPEQRAKHAAARTCIAANARFIQAIVAAAEQDGPEQGLTAIRREYAAQSQRPSPHDTDKVRWGSS